MNNFIYRFILNYYSNDSLENSGVYWIYNNLMDILIGPIFYSDLKLFKVSGNEIHLMEISENISEKTCFLIQQNNIIYNIPAHVQVPFRNCDEVINTVENGNNNIPYYKLKKPFINKKVVHNTNQTIIWEIDLLDKTLELKIDNYLHWKFYCYKQMSKSGMNLYLISPHSKAIGPIDLSEYFKQKSHIYFIRDILHNVMKPYCNSPNFRIDHIVDIVCRSLPNKLLVLFYYVSQDIIYGLIQTEN